MNHIQHIQHYATYTSWQQLSWLYLFINQVFWGLVAFFFFCETRWPDAFRSILQHKITGNKVPSKVKVNTICSIWHPTSIDPQSFNNKANVDGWTCIRNREKTLQRIRRLWRSCQTLAGPGPHNFLSIKKTRKGDRGKSTSTPEELLTIWTVSLISSQPTGKSRCSVTVVRMRI